MSSPPVPYIVGNVYHTHFQTRASPTHPDYRGTYSPPRDYIGYTNALNNQGGIVISYPNKGPWKKR